MNWQDSIIFLGAEDLEKVDEFYGNFLGLSLFKDQGLCRIYDIPGGGKIGFCSHMEKNTGDKSPIITLLTEEVDSVYQDSKNKGLEIVKKPAENKRFNIYHFFMKDPEGYCVEVQKFL